MASTKATGANAKINRLIAEVNETHESLLVNGERGNAVLISVEDWMAVQETPHLILISGMRESNRDGMAAPVGECPEEPVW